MKYLNSTGVCSELFSPTNGKVTWTGLTNGSTATYTCGSGYQLIGVETRTCLSSGVWSGQEPICESMKNILKAVKTFPLNVEGCRDGSTKK